MEMDAAAAAAFAAAALGACACATKLVSASPPQLTAAQAAAARAAVIGNLVGDSAAVTSHWVYDQAELKKKVDAIGGEKNAPFMLPINPFYHVEPGSQSCYGDQTYALLESMARAGPGKCDLAEFMAGLEATCGEGSDYGPLGRKITKADYPIKGPWRHGSLKQYFKNVSEGKNTPATSGSDDKQIDGACKVAPIVASYCALGLGAMLAACEAAIRVTQDTDESVAMGLAYARILESVIMGTASTPAEALELCITALRDPHRLQPNPLDGKLAQALSETVALKAMPLPQAALKLGLS